ncbi:MAG TPA: MotA/TolQ/ExbB proton channel family protein, partial [Paracoccus sp.]|nr:MotA/TolQ/ExbB proton channel family protein [Paracoccus sp. (in: a-proteobacteria)]
MTFDALLDFLDRGGPAMVAIAFLSVLTLALILWKTWDLARLGAWADQASEAALAEWQAGQSQAALARLAP